MSNNIVVGNALLKQQTGLRRIGLSRTYDLVILVASWELRSTSALLPALPLDGTTIVFKFRSTSAVLEAAKLEKLRMYRDADPTITIKELDFSTEFEINAAAMENVLIDVYKKVERPLRILFDITCMPKSITTFITGFCFVRGVASRIDCAYSEGDYTGVRFGTDRRPAELGIMSVGDWSSILIPYLNASIQVPKRRDVFVSLGGEIALSVSFLEKYEPTNVALAIVGEGFVDSPDHREVSEKAALDDLLREPNVVFERVNVSDAVGAARFMEEFARRSIADTVSGLALGPKPHALALGLVAIGSKKSELICRVPKSYYPIDVLPTGVFAFYEIEDRFDPGAYF